MGPAQYAGGDIVTVGAVARVGTCTVILAVICAGACADAITIDGSSSDWSSPDTINDDPNEALVSEAWDLDKSWYEWDDTNSYLCFAYLTYADTGNSDSDEARILLDVPPFDTGGGQPVSGGPSDIDYYLIWDMDWSSPALYKWFFFPGSYMVVSGADVDVAHGSGADADFTEWHVAASDVGLPVEFEWCAYLHDSGFQAYDYSPDGYEQRGFIPEPGTLALLPLGLAGLAIWRRHRSTEDG